MVKLTDRWIAWFVRQAARGRETPQVWAPKTGVTVRRLQQLVQTYRRTNVAPTLKTNRRPKAAALTIQEQEWIERGREATHRGARKIWLWLRKQGVRIPKHKIHGYASARRWSTPNARKKKKRNRTRYERDHSGSLFHGYWRLTANGARLARDCRTLIERIETLDRNLRLQRNHIPPTNPSQTQLQSAPQGGLPQTTDLSHSDTTLDTPTRHLSTPELPGGRIDSGTRGAYGPPVPEAK